MIWQQTLGAKLILALSAAALFTSTAVSLKLMNFEGKTSSSIRWFTKDNIFTEVFDRASGEVTFDKPILIEFMMFGCSSCEDWYPIWNEIAEENSDAFEVASMDCSGEAM